MANIYYDSDADLSVLEGKTVAVIGYGSQGRGQSLCLRDSGINVLIGARPGKSFDRAKEDGFEVVSAGEAASRADVIQILAQDHLQAEIYEKEVLPHLTAGKAVLFSHGFNIHYGFIKPQADIDILMVAPKGPGPFVRRQYEEGKGVPALIAIHQDATGNARKIGLAYAKGLGATRAAVYETSFKEETESDLFGEQAVLCGGASELIRAGFETLVEAGYAPEMAYFECLHEMKLIVDLMYEKGITGMRAAISDTAKWGDVNIGRRIITPATKEEMKKVLSEIQSGQFAREWMAENANGRHNFDSKLEADKNHQIEKVGEKLRGDMSWMKK
ncbi:ketol-acid reductoisomerase [Abditibacterium utsteinense]|uniref:Ketol-acid reductoisomerase (NADP(+)) n=1 Tax=Abditibacterium utsteinense TaxID=1960156 RepID=A0A2S8SUL2_9BACT|nr:ketol-acid reductoisomerase [Abditibacterium utsteinense]PQV64485.1 ketol-acid reductoisomerase [Abditibacterium utsteinense]